MNIFLGLNTKLDLNLASKLRQSVPLHTVDFYVLDSLNSSHIHGSFDRIENIKGGKKKVRFDSMTLLRNLKSNLDYFQDIDLKEEELAYKNSIIEYFESINEYDIFCFSVYGRYIFNYILIVSILKKRFPSSAIIVGGPEIILEDGSREIFERLGCVTSTGDIESSIKTFIEKGNSSTFSNMKNFDLSNVPKYNEDELQYLNGYIQLTGSRGCPNNCYFCSTPKLGKFNAVSRKVYAQWIDYYQSIGVKKILLADNTLNSFDFDTFLDNLQGNQINLLEADITLDKLSQAQVMKMKNVGFNSFSMGLEGVHPDMSNIINKKMPSYQEIYDLIHVISSEGIKLNLFYIFGMPGQTRDIFMNELEFIYKINSSFPSVTFELYPYFLAPKSYIDANREKFRVQASNLYNVYSIEIPEFTTALEKIVIDYTYPEIEDLYNKQQIAYSTIKNVRG